MSYNPYSGLLVLLAVGFILAVAWHKPATRQPPREPTQAELSQAISKVWKELTR